MDDLYGKSLLIASQNPVYGASWSRSDISFEDENPLCGDVFVWTCDWTTADRMLQKLSLSGHGCAISQASADLLMESIIGKKKEEIKALSKQDVLDNLGIELER